jgi:hypothetical protein
MIKEKFMENTVTEATLALYCKEQDHVQRP